MKITEKDAQILQAIQKYRDEIAETIRFFGDRKSTFMNNYMYRNACSMPLQTIGELAKGFSTDFLEESTEIPWKEIKGMRTLFAHVYDKGIDLEKVWNTIKHDVPVLGKYCKDTLRENDYEILIVRSAQNLRTENRSR